MAAHSTLSNFPSLNKILSTTIFNPLLTGPLLLFLQRNPSLLAKLPWPGYMVYTIPFELPFDLHKIRIGATPPLKTLRFLFLWGVLLYANRFFNRLALNYGHLRKQGVPWDFGSESKETILITGGCSGFGKEMVKQFAEQTRARIIVLDIQDLPEDLKDIQRLTYHKVDLSDTTAIESTIAKVLEDSPPTVLINNAGIAQPHTLLSTPTPFLQKIFAVNILSHFALIRLLLPTMLRAKKGHIVSLASMASYTGTAGLGDYSATKAAVLALHETLLTELGTRYEKAGGHCIQASIIHPLWARTPLVTPWEGGLVRERQPVLEADEVARKVVEQVLGGRSGSVFVPEGMWVGSLLRALPDWVGVRSRMGTSRAVVGAEEAGR